jgi:galactokinase/mevalonate kinase-like predicted kinase
MDGGRNRAKRLAHQHHDRKRRIAAPAGQLAEEACYIEIEVLGEPIGKQDQ